MAIKHNQQIQKNHFHKDWYVSVAAQFLPLRNLLLRSLRLLGFPLTFAGNATSACTSTR
jgi:hypothetical protein